jgi:hypothetical protein
MHIPSAISCPEEGHNKKNTHIRADLKRTKPRFQTTIAAEPVADPLFGESLAGLVELPRKQDPQSEARVEP